MGEKTRSLFCNMKISQSYKKAFRSKIYSILFHFLLFRFFLFHFILFYFILLHFISFYFILFYFILLTSRSIFGFSTIQVYCSFSHWNTREIYSSRFDNSVSYEAFSEHYIQGT